MTETRRSEIPGRPPRAERRSKTRPALDAAFADCRASLLEPDGLSAERRRSSIATLVSVVQRYDLPPERFLALFKKMAVNLPDIVRLRADERVAAMRVLAQTAIDIYYTAAAAADGADAGASASSG